MLRDGQYIACAVFCLRRDPVSRRCNGLGSAIRRAAAPVHLHPDAERNAGAGCGADRRFLDFHRFVRCVVSSLKGWPAVRKPVSCGNKADLGVGFLRYIAAPPMWLRIDRAGRPSRSEWGLSEVELCLPIGRMLPEVLRCVG
jgi:hypothetical protein